MLSVARIGVEVFIYLIVTSQREKIALTVLESAINTESTTGREQGLQAMS
jgi:hypothetical protein